MKRLHILIPFVLGLWLIGLLFATIAYTAQAAPQNRARLLVPAATCTWVGGSGLWSDPTKWTCGHAPGADDSVHIKAASAVVTINSNETMTVTDLVISRTLGMTPATLRNYGHLTVGGVYVFNGGILDLDDTNARGSLRAGSSHLVGGVIQDGGTIETATFTFVSGTLGDSGVITVSSSFEMYLSNAPTVINGRTLYIQAFAATYGAIGAQPLTGAGGAFEIDSAATFNISGTHEVTFNPTSLNINNAGVFAFNLPVTATGTLGAGVTFSGPGAIHVRSGALEFNRSTDFENDFLISRTGWVYLNKVGGSFSFAEGVNLAGEGWLELYKGKLELFYPMVIPNLKLLAGATIQNELKLSQPLTISQRLLWEAGPISAFSEPQANLIIAPGAIMTLTNDVDHNLTDITLDNYGTVVLSDTFRTRSTDVTINNYAGAVYHVRTSTTLDDIPTFNNAGLVWVSDNSDFSFGASTIHSNGGEFHATAGSRLRFGVSGGSKNFHDGTLFSGAGINQLDQGNIYFDGTFTSENLEFANGYWYGTATLDGSLNWSGGTMRGGGVLTVPQGSVIHVSGDQDRTMMDYTLNNYGLFDWGGNWHNLVFYSGAMINNYGVWDSTGAGDTSIADATTFTFNNFGVLRKSGGAGYTDMSRGTFVNSGLVEVLAGDLRIKGNGTQTHSGDFYIAEDGILTIGTATHVFDSGVSITGAGALKPSGGVLNFNPPVTVTVGGYIQNGGTINVNGNTIHVTGNAWSASGGGNLNLQGGTFSVDGNFDLETSLYLGGGVLDVGGDLLMGWSLDLDSGVAFVGGNFGNGYGYCEIGAGMGMVVFDGSGVQAINCGSDSPTFYNLTVQSGVILDTTSTPYISLSNVTGLLQNYGVIRHSHTPAGGLRAFGLTGAWMTISTAGTLTAIMVDRVDSQHPSAEPGIQPDKYWAISPSPANASGYNVSLTLPHNGLPDPYACRDDAWGWSCERAAFTASSVTRSNITHLSDWAVSSQTIPYHQADLAVTESAPTGAYSGQIITFTLSATNATTSTWDADALLVKTFDPVEAITALSGSGPGGSCAAVGAVITCTLNNLLVGSSRDVQVTAVLSHTFTGILSNTVTITPTDALDPDASNNFDFASVTVTPPPPDVYIHKSGTEYTMAGGMIGYTLAYGNQGVVTADQVTLTDYLPNDVTFVSATGNPQVNGQSLLWTLGTLLPGSSGTFEVIVQSSNTLPNGTLLVNNAVIDTTTPGDPAGNNATAFTTEISDVVLTVQKSADVVGAQVGDIVEYTVFIRNDSQMPITPTLTDLVPFGSVIQGLPSATRGEVWLEGETVFWQEADFEPQAEVWVTFAVEVTACEGEAECGVLHNNAQVTVEGVQHDWNAAVDVFISCPDLSVTVSGPRYGQFTDSGHNFVITYTNSNAPLSVAATPLLTITLPDVGMHIGGVFPPPTQWVNEETAVWELPSLAPGGSDTIELQAAWDEMFDGRHIFHSFAVQTAVQDTASPARPPECTINLPDNEAAAITYGITMGFEKYPLAGMPKPDGSASGLQMVFDPLPKLQSNFYLRWDYGNYDPLLPAVINYLVRDSWPPQLGPIVNYHLQDSLTRKEDTVWFAGGVLYNQFSRVCYEFGMFNPYTCHFAVGDRWARQMTGLQPMTSLPAPGTIVTNTATITYTLPVTMSNQTFQEQDTAAVTIPHFAPLLTAPESGEMCPGPVNLQGLAQPGVNVVISNTVSGVEFGSAPPNGEGVFDIGGEVVSGTYTLAAYSRLPGRSDVPAQAGPSNAITVRVHDTLPWNPQLSLWETTIRGMPVTYRFRNPDGEYSVNGWQIAVIPAHSQSHVSIYSCDTCPNGYTARFVLIADNVPYNESSRNGSWHYFDYMIENTHEVSIIRECVDENGDVGSSTPGDGTVLVDPDGYVFDVDDGGAYDPVSGMYAPITPLEGITVTAYMWYPQWGGWTPWPAHMYGQTNPQVTTGTYADGVPIPGYFAFFTPPGLYYLQVTGDNGYQDWRSPVVEVITEIVHVNVPLTRLPDEETTIYPITLTVAGAEPAWLTVPAGSAVAWEVQLRDTDTITDALDWMVNPILHPLSDVDPLLNRAGFDAGYLLPGQFYIRRFDQGGTYTYTDANGHSGTVVVTSVERKIYLPVVLRPQAAARAQAKRESWVLWGTILPMLLVGVAVRARRPLRS